MRLGSAVLIPLLLLAACADEQELGPAELVTRGARLDSAGAALARPGAAPAASTAPDAGEAAAVAAATPEQDAAEAATGDGSEGVEATVAAGDASNAPASEGTRPAAPAVPEPTPEEPSAPSGPPILTWNDLILPDERVDDLVDALLYPESYPEEDRVFPEPIARHDGQVITVEGYMVPLEWAGERVRSLMLVGDLLACCFGTAPEPDAWVEVVMEGEGAEYFVQLPVLVTGTFRIEGLDDGTGYAAGCYTMKATSLVLNED